MNVEQRVLWHKEREVNEKSDTYKSKEATIGGIPDCFLTGIGLRDHIKTLKGELVELIKLMDSGFVVGAKKSCDKGCIWMVVQLMEQM